MLALTFDDGPDPRGTPGVLDALDAAGVKATFFVLGERTDAHPELLARVLAEGHDVQLHGHAHLRHPAHARADIERDLDRALEALRKASLTPTTWRIPWGQLADFTPELAASRNLTLAGWTQDTIDWRGDPAQAMLARIHPTPGAIVLAHDGIGIGALRTDARETVELIGPLVEKVRRCGLEPGPLTAPWPIPVPLGNPEFHPGVGPPA